MKDKFDNLKPLIELGWGDELIAYEEKTDDADVVVIKVKSVEEYPNYKIIFDGNYYYLINKESMICKDKVKENLIPEGFAKVL